MTKEELEQLKSKAYKSSSVIYDRGRRMTEELKQEVEEYIKWCPTEGTKDFIVYKVKGGENAFIYVVEHKNELSSSDWVKMYEGTERECYRVVGYLDSVEPREKRITELEAQIEKMKCLLNEIYVELVRIRNDLPIEIQEVIKEIKEK